MCLIGEVRTQREIDLRSKLTKVQNEINVLRFNLSRNHLKIAKLEFEAANLRDSLKMAGVV